MRKNTAAPEMIEDFKNLKKTGVKEFICSVFVNGEFKHCEIRATAQGVSSYANSQFRKYGDSTTVEVQYFSPSYHTLRTYTTYQA